MRVSEDEDRLPVQTGETTKLEKPELAEPVKRWERQTAALGKDMHMELSKPWISETAQDSRQTLNEASLDTGDVAAPNEQ